MNTLAPLSHSWRLAQRLVARFNDSHCPLLASAIAFYGFLSVIPGFAVLISAFGLLADPTAVARVIDGLQGVFPEEAIDLLSQQLQAIVAKQGTQLGLGLMIGLVVTLWSARSAAASLMSALNLVYGCVDKRGFVEQEIVATGITLVGILATVIALFVVAGIPVVLAFLPIAFEPARLLSVIRWPVIGLAVVFGFLLLYRYVPYRVATPFSRLSVAAICGAFLWVAGSGGFSLYVSSFGSYDRVYGSLGAVVVLLMWFYISALAILVGAVIDAELELQSGRGKCTG